MPLLDMEVRKVRPIEINQEIKFLPNAVFGYVYNHDVARYYKTPLNFKFRTSALTVSDRLFFKIEKISEICINLYGYISDESEFSQDSKGRILVFPFPYKEFKNEFKIKLGSSLNIKSRDIEDDKGQVIGILEIESLAPVKSLPKNWLRGDFISLIIALISIPWWPTLFSILKRFFITIRSFFS